MAIPMVLPFTLWKTLRKAARSLFFGGFATLVVIFCDSSGDPLLCEGRRPTHLVFVFVFVVDSSGDPLQRPAHLRDGDDDGDGDGDGDDDGDSSGDPLLCLGAETCSSRCRTNGFSDE